MPTEQRATRTRAVRGFRITLPAALYARVVAAAEKATRQTQFPVDPDALIRIALVEYLKRLEPSLK